MGVFYYEEKELPEYNTTDANKVLKIDSNGIYVQWLAETIDLPVQTGNANKLLTTNGTTAAWTPNLTTTSSTLNVGSTALNGANLMTLNQNGAANFNVITPDYPSIFLPVTNTGLTSTGNLFMGIDYNSANGVYVITSSTITGGAARVFVSGSSGSANYLSSFTSFTDTTVNTSNIRSVAFGNGVWCVMGHGTGTGQLVTTSVATALSGWTRITGAPWNSSRTTQRLKYINNQFVALFSASYIRISTNGTSWTELLINATSYQLQDIEYLPELRRYVIVTNSAGILYYDNTTIPTGGATFTFVSVTNGQGNSVVWSSKLGLLLYQNSSGLITYSRDGVNYTQYTAPGTWNFARLLWTNDFGGVFLTAIYQSTNNFAFSRDGFNWTLLNNGIADLGAVVHYNSGNKILFHGMQNNAVYKNLTSLSLTYLDPEATYATYNSNLKLRDNIEYEPQVITTATGNTHYTTQSFTRSVISFNTTSANANIYLQGASFNGRIGTKFKIVKTVSTNFGVRIHPYEACRIVTPAANVLNYNITNSIYDLIPQNYFGSFELTRVNDETDGIYTGTWLVDNVNVFPLLGGQRYTTNVEVAGSLTVEGTLNTANLVPTGYIQLNNNADIKWTSQTNAPMVEAFYDFTTPTLSYMRFILPIDASTSGENVRFNTMNSYFWKPVYNTKPPSIQYDTHNAGVYNISSTTPGAIFLYNSTISGNNPTIQFPTSGVLLDGAAIRVYVQTPNFPSPSGSSCFLVALLPMVVFTGSGTITNVAASTNYQVYNGSAFEVIFNNSESKYYVIRLS